ncbi:MAG: SO_0444 family Cu/Zn efflux transporter [Verrucomicrobiota bacterium]
MNMVLTALVEFWEVLSEMAPYLLFGFLVAGVLSVFLSAKTVEKHLGGKGLKPVVTAAFWGVPLPLCSCSVIPVAASLRRHGASRGSTAAFLLSTPQTGVDSIFVTYSLLGLTFAVFRPIAAFVTGLFGGYLVEVFGGRNGESTGEAPPHCEDECCAPKRPSSRLVRALRYGFLTLPGDIGKELLVGLVIAGAITAAVPDDFFARVLAPGFLQMLVMMAVGIPMYVCATASVPIAAALMAKGISPGAAFVFLMTGPGTNAATIVTLGKLLGGRSAAIYLGVVAGMSLAWGLLLDYVFRVAPVAAAHQGHWMMPGYVLHASAVVLLLVLAFALFRPGPKGAGDDVPANKHGT